MKWMLIVLVFGSHPMETGLFYNSLDDCVKAEMRPEWARIGAAWLKEYREQPVTEGFIAKQTPWGRAFPMPSAPADEALMEIRAGAP
jgi:hypothetical protein